MPRFEHDGISHYYTVAGDGYPLVFIHGLGLSHQNWIGQLPVFARSYRVIAYDMRGHGGTAASSGDTTIRTYSDDLRALLDHLGIEQAVLIGYSSGTLIAEQFALDHPDRTTGLCLIGPFARLSGIAMRTKVTLTRLLLSARLRLLMAYATATHNAENLTQRGFFYRIAKRNSPEEVLRFLHAADHTIETKTVAQIACPVLLVHGTRDFMTAHYVKELQHQLPHVEVATVEGCNHAVATRALGTFNHLLSIWLTRHLPERPADPEQPSVPQNYPPPLAATPKQTLR